MTPYQQAADILRKALAEAHTRDPTIILPILEEEANDAVLYWANCPDAEVEVSAAVADIYTTAVSIAELDIAARRLVQRIPTTWSEITKRHFLDARTASLEADDLAMYKITISAWSLIARKLEQNKANQ